MKKSFLLLAAVIAVAFYCQPAQAVLINMDFGKGDNGFGTGDSVVHTGGAVLGGPAMTWNATDTEMNDFTETANLDDSSGSSTGVTLVWDDFAQSSVNSGAIEFGSTGHNPLMEDYAFTAGGTAATYTLSNLNPGDTYTFVLFGVPDGDLQDTLFAVTGANEAAQAVDMGQVNDDNGLATPEDYVTFTGTIDGTGTLIWTQTTFSNQQGGFSGSNGFQLDVSAVPEPSSAILLVIGLVSLGCVGWRRGRSCSK